MSITKILQPILMLVCKFSVTTILQCKIYNAVLSLVTLSDYCLLLVKFETVSKTILLGVLILWWLIVCMKFAAPCATLNLQRKWDQYCLHPSYCICHKCIFKYLFSEFLMN